MSVTEPSSKALRKSVEREAQGSALWGCSSAGRAPALQAGGQEFDPPHLHQRDTKGRTKRSYGRIAQVVRAHA